MSVTEQTKGCNEGTQILGIIIQFKHVVLHGDIKLGEVLVSFTSGQDVSNPW